MIILASSAISATKTRVSDKSRTDTNATEKIVKQTFTSLGKSRTFYLFVPDNITAAKPAPLILMLHGSSRNGISLVEKWRDLAAKEGFIIAGPDSNNSDRWSATDDSPDFLHDLVEHLKSQYPINPRRVYLFGHSAGAVYALTISMVESEYFAATAIHAGAWRMQNEYSVLSSVRRKIPIAIWVGTRDPHFQLPEVRATHDALKAKGIPIQVTEMPNHDHNYYDLAPTINQSAWEFLKQYELSDEPRYAPVGTAEDNVRANALLQEINNLRTNAFDLSRQADAVDKELVTKYSQKQAGEVKRLAEQELALLTRSGVMWWEAADKAESAAKLRLNDKNTRYFSLIAKHNRKNAEVQKALRGQVEPFLSNDSVEAIRAKRNEVTAIVVKLQQEAIELQKQLEELMK